MKKPLKLKTEIIFNFDNIEIDKDIVYDIYLKEKKKDKIKEVLLPNRNNKFKQQDSSTKLF